MDSEGSGGQGPRRPAGRLIYSPWRGAGAGWGALAQTLKHASAEMGLVRGLRILTRLNQTEGFDCPGCAWPEPDERSWAEFCENGAKAVAEEATTRRVGPELFELHDVDELETWTDYQLGKAGRLTEPLVLRPGDRHYRPLSWEEALDLAAEGLRALDEPDRAIFYTSGRTSNEAAFLYQLLARLLGTNNLPDCSNLCHESSGYGLSRAIGVGKGTVTLRDFTRSDCILVIGQNPGTNHPRMLGPLQAAARRGARVIVINPLEEPSLVRFQHPQEVLGMLNPVGGGDAIATDYLQVRVGGDQALLEGLAKAMLELEEQSPGTVLARDFIDQRTSGFETWAEGIRSRSWERLAADSGITEGELRRVGGLLAASGAAIACWAMGITQHPNGVANVQAIVNLLLLGGHLGRPGAGVCPVRGHSNVQGDRTMGIWERPSEVFLDRLAATFEFAPPREHGLAAVEALKAMHEGRVDVFMAMGGNLVGAAPDTHYSAEALRRCGLTIHVATKLNRSHLAVGAASLLLPCLGRTERDRQGGAEQVVTVENSMGIVHTSRGRLVPASEHLRSEPWIVCELARRAAGDRAAVDWAGLAADYDRIRELIARTIPGFDDYNRAARSPGGLELPNAARQGRFETSDGLAHFTSHELPDLGLAAGELRLMTLRSHDQYNTTIYGLDDRYRGVYGERRVVLMSQADMADRGLEVGDSVDVESRHGGVSRRVQGFQAVPARLPPGSCGAYFPEANPLIPIDRYAAGSLTPASKNVVVTITPSPVEDSP